MNRAIVQMFQRTSLNSTYLASNRSGTFNNCCSRNDVVDASDYTWTALSMIAVMIFGITGNTLVIIAVTVERRLQSVTNYFLLSLALTDMLVSIIVMPFSIVHIFLGYWPFGVGACNLYVTSDVLMCTCSIFHMCTISLERFLAIRFPLKTRNRSKTVVGLKICVVWIASLVISSPVTMLGYAKPSYILNEQQCTLVNDNFIIYGSIFAFFIPLLIMVIAYALTVYMLHKQVRNCREGGRNGAAPLIRRSRSTRGSRRDDSSLKKPRTRAEKSLSYPIRRHSSDSVDIRTPSTVTLTPVHEMARLNTNQNLTPEKSSIPLNHRYRTVSDSEMSDSSLIPANDKIDKFPRIKLFSAKNSVKVKATHAQRATRYELYDKHNEVRSEQKASKVLGIVFLIFVILWTPFFTVNVMTALCKTCFFEPMLVNAFVWLGYVSSTLNPIIYTVFNSIFKKTFIKLILCRYNSLERPRRSVRCKFTSNSSSPCSIKPFRDQIKQDDISESKL